MSTYTLALSFLHLVVRFPTDLTTDTKCVYIRITGLGDRGLIFGSGWNFFPSLPRPTQPPYPMRIGVSFPEVTAASA